MNSIKSVIDKNYAGPTPVSFVIQFDEDIPENIINAFLNKTQSSSSTPITVFESVSPGSKILYSTTCLREDIVVRNVVDIINSLMVDYGREIGYYFSQPVWSFCLKN